MKIEKGYSPEYGGWGKFVRYQATQTYCITQNQRMKIKIVVSLPQQSRISSFRVTHELRLGLFYRYVFVMDKLISYKWCPLERFLITGFTTHLYLFRSSSTYGNFTIPTSPPLFHILHGSVMPASVARRNSRGDSAARKKAVRASAVEIWSTALRSAAVAARWIISITFFFFSH